MQTTVNKVLKTKRYTRRKPFEVTKKNWKPLYTKILLFAEQGLPARVIAEKVCVSTDTIGRVTRSSYFIEKLKQANEKIIDKTTSKAATKAASRNIAYETRKVLESASEQAARRMKKALKDPNSLTRIQLEVCKDILDRTGHKPKEVVETHERVYPPEETQSALITAQEVEGVLKRLSNQNSRFLVTNQKTDDRSPETDASPGTTAITEASPPRQETEPA